jgi:hypothetical protein
MVTSCAECAQEVSARTSCTVDTYTDFADGVPRPRLPYPEHAHWAHCPDCRVPRGGYHHPGCTEEECPRCHLRVSLACDCPLKPALSPV